MTLPLLVRGRVPVLDAVGGLIWAAALITALRLLGRPGRRAERRSWSPRCWRRPARCWCCAASRGVRPAPTGTVERGSDTMIRRAL